MANQLEDSMKEPTHIIIRPPGVNDPQYDGATDKNWLHSFMKSNEPSPLLEGLRKLASYLENTPFSQGTRVGNRMFGTGGEERYQFWPERMIRSAVTLPGDVMSGETSVQSIDPVTGETHTSPQAIERAQDTAGLMGSSTLFRAPTPNTLGSGAMRFYSPVEQAIENATQTKGPLQQWLGFLKNSKNVKPEELSWLGLENAPELQGNITKQQLQDYVNAHKVNLQEVTKGAGNIDKDKLNRIVDDTLDGRVDDFILNEGRDPTPAEVENIRWGIEDEVETYPSDFGINGPKYSDYQLPGGTNYREHLLTLPDRQPDPIDTRGWTAKENPNIRTAGGDKWWEITAPDGKTIPSHGASQEDAIANAVNNLSKRSDISNNYQSSHWDEPNVLAHIRSNERDVEGVPSLHLEEIQSDWHQQGRKKGYNVSAKQEAAEKSELSGLEDKWVETGRAGMTQDEYSRMQELAKKRYNIGVPDAPFKTSWPELALKRMIQLAAQEGKSRISWTPGEAQAARYDLSKQVKEVRFNPEDNHLVVKGTNGQSIYNQKVDPNKLPDLIGKEATDKLIKTEQVGGYHRLEGDGLKVGGEGLKGFYDKMLPKMVEKLGKQYGVKVKQGTTGGKNLLNTWDDGFGYSVGNEKGRVIAAFDTKKEAIDYMKAHSGPSVYYFDIPPELATQATGKGMPLFVGGVPVVPVNGNPFEEERK